MTADPSWQPLLTTVPEPDYPSGHGVLSGVAEAVLRKYDTCIQYDTYIVKQCCASMTHVFSMTHTLLRCRCIAETACCAERGLCVYVRTVADKGFCHCDSGCWHDFCLAGLTLETVHC